MFYINFRHRFFPLWRFLSSAGDLKVGVSGIVEFRLLEWKVPPNSAGTSFNAHPENAFMLLKTFYAALLRYDPYWHFLHEGSFTLLRVSSCFKKMIQMYLVAAKVEYTVGVWGEDNQEATKKYQRIYTYIFHGTSILAMECDSYNDAWKASDRVIHCSNLQQIYHLYDTHKHLYTMWEMGFLLDLAVARGRFVAGMWQLELPETTVIDWAKHTIDYQFAKKEEEVHEKAQIN
jgi:hypothetical protein